MPVLASQISVDIQMASCRRLITKAHLGETTHGPSNGWGRGADLNWDCTNNDYQ